MKYLGEWQDRLLAEGAFPPSQVGNIKTFFRQVSMLVGGTPDPYTVPINLAKGLQRRWEAYQQELLASGKIKANTERSYRGWCQKALEWAQKNVGLFDEEACAKLLGILDGPMWEALDYLDKNVPHTDVLGVRRLFGYMDDHKLSLVDLETQADEILAQYEEGLKATGVKSKTWKTAYRDATRGLRRLQEDGLLPQFPLRSHTSWRVKQYGIPYSSFKNVTLRDAVTNYHLRASEKLIIGDDSWQHPIIKERTRDDTIRRIQRYVGYLENVAQINTAKKTTDELVSAEYLEGYAGYYRTNQGIEGTDITSGLESILRSIRGFWRQYLGLLPDPRGEDRFHLVSRYCKVVDKRPQAERIRTLPQWGAIIKQAGQNALETTNKEHARCQLRLRMYCLISLCAPARPGNMRGLILGKQLVQDPLTKQWWVRLSPQVTKHRHPYEIPLPGFVVADLEDYLTNIRPAILKNKSSKYVFPSAKGGAVAKEVILKELSVIDMDIHGVKESEAVHPHTVRHTTVITCARTMSKGGLHRGGKLIGHTSIQTTLKFYAKNARAQADQDRQAERILGQDVLVRKDVHELLSILDREPNGLARFSKAFWASKDVPK